MKVIHKSGAAQTRHPYIISILIRGSIRGARKDVAKKMRGFSQWN